MKSSRLTRRSGCAAAALAGALSLAACGSTVSGTATGQLPPGAAGAPGPGVAVGSGAELGSAGTGATGQGGVAGGSGAAGGGPSSQQGSGMGSSSQPGTSAGSGAPVAGAPTTATAAAGRGVTATTILLGVPETRGAGDAARAVGAETAASPPDRPMYQAVIDYLNKNGGVLGRRIVPVFARFDFSSAETVDQQYQRMCDTWTKDNKVFAVLQGNNETLEQCLANRQTAELGGLNTNSTSETYRRYPLYIEQSSINLDRIGDILPRGLHEQGYFRPWDIVRGDPATTGQVKVGVISLDDPAYRSATEKHLVPALRRLGYDPLVRYLPPIRSYSEAGSASSAAAAAALAFKGEGVDHVIPFDGRLGVCAGCATVFFLQAANQQKYYPRYGMNTQVNLSVLSRDTTLEPPDQLHGALAIGWAPSRDLVPADDPVSGHPASRRLCAKIFREAQMPPDGLQIEVCDAVFFFKRVVEAGGEPINNGSWLAGAHRLARSYESTITLGTFLAPDRHDGASLVRPAAYVDSCACYRYTGPPRSAASP